MEFSRKPIRVSSSKSRDAWMTVHVVIFTRRWNPEIISSSIYTGKNFPLQLRNQSGNSIIWQDWRPLHGGNLLAASSVRGQFRTSWCGDGKLRKVQVDKEDSGSHLRETSGLSSEIIIRFRMQANDIDMILLRSWEYFRNVHNPHK